MDEYGNCIYLFTFPDGMKYVGQTTNYNSRLKNHKSNMIHHKYKNRGLYSAMRKYGWDGFDKEIIWHSISKENLTKYEQYFIDYYNSYFGGYNQTPGLSYYNKLYSIRAHLNQYGPRTISDNSFPSNLVMKNLLIQTDNLILLSKEYHVNIVFTINGDLQKYYFETYGHNREGGSVMIKCIENKTASYSFKVINGRWLKRGKMGDGYICKITKQPKNT